MPRSLTRPRALATGLLLATVGAGPALAARPAAPTAAERAAWPLQRARTGGAQDGVVLVETGPPAPAALGPHRGLATADLDDCWLQHAGAADHDLDLAFCAAVEVSAKGTVSSTVALDLERDPTRLARCIETVLDRIQSAPDAPAQATICRAVQTHTSAAARERWRADPRAKVRVPVPQDAAWGTVVVGRADREGATRIAPLATGSDPLGGPLRSLLSTPAPLGAKDRIVASARRHLEAATPAIRACAGRHLAWRHPGQPVTATLVLTVSHMGVVDLEGAGAQPPAYADVADCIAAALDPGIGAAPGDHRIRVPVTIQPG